MKTEKSAELFQQAQNFLVGGVNSPVRAFRAVGGTPLFIARAQGSHIFDVDGTRYIDYVGSWGPAILGHAHPEVLAAVVQAAQNGLSFGAPHEGELLLAKQVVELYPAIEMLRLTSSGTEAVMGALRVARAHTGRDKVVKFAGCYHGHADHLLVRAGSGAQTLGVPDSAGVPASFSAHTLIAEFNDLASVEKWLKKFPNEIAAVIVEPVMGNIGLVPPLPGFLQGLRELTERAGSLLIFDEVMTGFRVALGGAQARYQVQPDLTVLGKIIGGGMPVGAFGGKREIMEKLAPLGPAYQAGTLSGNPLAVAAGLATLRLLKKPGFYENLEKISADLMLGIEKIVRQWPVPVCVQRVGSMFSLFFHAGPVCSAKVALAADTQNFKSLFHHLLRAGIYMAPSAFEAGFVSAAHAPADIAETLAAFAAFRL